MAAKQKSSKADNRRGPDLEAAKEAQRDEIRSLMNAYGRQSGAGDIFPPAKKSAEKAKGKDKQDHSKGGKGKK